MRTHYEGKKIGLEGKAQGLNKLAEVLIGIFLTSPGLASEENKIDGSWKKQLKKGMVTISDYLRTALDISQGRIPVSGYLPTALDVFF